MLFRSLAVNKGAITVFGGKQMRPNLHIEDMVDLYSLVLKLPEGQIAGKIYNAGYQNHPVAEIAERVKTVVQAEMTDFALPGNFRLALIPYNTFMHLLTTAAQSAALRCVRQHLQPGAVLALAIEALITREKIHERPQISC